MRTVKCSRARVRSDAPGSDKRALTCRFDTDRGRRQQTARRALGLEHRIFLAVPEPLASPEATVRMRRSPQGSMWYYPDMRSTAPRNLLSAWRQKGQQTMTASAAQAAKDARDFREKAILSVIDKAVLGVFVAVTTAYFTNRVDTIRDADTQASSVTKMRLDETLKEYQRAVATHENIVSLAKSIGGKIENGDGIDAEIAEAKRIQERLRTITGYADTLWLEPSVALPLITYESDLRTLVEHVLSLPACVADVIAGNSRATKSSRRIVFAECARAYTRVERFAGRHMWEFRYAFSSHLDRLTYRPGVLVGERPRWLMPTVEEIVKEQQKETAVLNSMDDLGPDAAFLDLLHASLAPVDSAVSDAGAD